MSHTVHRNLLWLSGQPEKMELLLKDPSVAKLVALQLSPDLVAFRREDQEKVETRLAKLGHAPARSGRWT